MTIIMSSVFSRTGGTSFGDNADVVAISNVHFYIPFNFQLFLLHSTNAFRHASIAQCAFNLRLQGSFSTSVDKAINVTEMIFM